MYSLSSSSYHQSYLANARLLHRLNMIHGEHFATAHAAFWSVCVLLKLLAALFANSPRLRCSVWYHDIWGFYLKASTLIMDEHIDLLVKDAKIFRSRIIFKWNKYLLNSWPCIEHRREEIFIRLQMASKIGILFKTTENFVKLNGPYEELKLITTLPSGGKCPYFKCR